MFIGGLNWETTDGNFTCFVKYCAEFVKNPYERTLNSLEKSPNVLLCEKIKPVDLEDLDSSPLKILNVSTPSWSRNISLMARL